MRKPKDIFRSEYDSERPPLYRAYGVWRKKHPVYDKIFFYGIRAVVLFVLAVIGLALFATFLSLLLYADILVATVFILIVAIVLTVVFTRTLRKRLRLLRRIKKLCTEKKYRLRQNRKFLHSFKWDDKEPDFILETGRYVYYVHLLTVAKYNSTLTFRSPDFIEKVSYPLNNKFTLIFEFSPKRVELPTHFKPLPTDDRKRHIRTVLVNPVCREMYETDREGGVLATGNGMEKFGYTVFTGSGFAEAIRRNEEKQGNIRY